MYNQYIPAPREDVHNERHEPAAPAMTQQQPQQAPTSPPQMHQQQHHQTVSAFGNLSQALGSRLGSIKFDADTLIAIAVIWFLLNDGEEIDTELLMIIGVLLILGI